MKKVLAILLVVVMVFCMASCGKKNEEPDIFEKSEGVMTYEEYMAAAVDSEVTIEGFVQKASYAQAYGNANLFLADKDGAYYAYRVVCDDALAAKLVPGAKVRVKGFKAEWSGEVEIAEGCTAEVLEGSYIAPAVDLTTVLGTDDMVKSMNKLAVIKGLKVEPSTIEGTDYAFLYNWDGSGAAGSNSDLYVNVSLNGATYQFCVESDEFAEGTDVYTAVTGLQIGDVIDVEGFVYWYNGPQIHIAKVTK